MGKAPHAVTLRPWNTETGSVCVKRQQRELYEDKVWKQMDKWKVLYLLLYKRWLHSIMSDSSSSDGMLRRFWGLHQVLYSII